MRFDTTPAVVDDPRPPERELWAGVRWLRRAARLEGQSGNQSGKKEVL